MKNLLVFHDAGSDSNPRLDFAADLAGALDAHLTSLSMTIEPAFMISGGSLTAAELWAQRLEAIRQEAADLAQAAEERLQRADLSAERRSASLPIAAASRMAALHARYADLSIIGYHLEGPRAALQQEIFDGTLFDSGRPILATPPEADAGKLLKSAMVAWDGGPHAARALGDALPLLSRAEKIAVVVVAPEVEENGHGEEPGGDIALYLARHGLNVEVHQSPASGRSIAEVLSTRARELDAGMIVMGGFGHSRFTETVFGGVTQELLENAAVPLFMSH